MKRIILTALLATIPAAGAQVAGTTSGQTTSTAATNAINLLMQAGMTTADISAINQAARAKNADNKVIAAMLAQAMSRAGYKADASQLTSMAKIVINAAQSGNTTRYLGSLTTALNYAMSNGGKMTPEEIIAAAKESETKKVAIKTNSIQVNNDGMNCRSRYQPPGQSTVFCLDGIIGQVVGQIDMSKAENAVGNGHTPRAPRPPTPGETSGADVLKAIGESGRGSVGDVKVSIKQAIALGGKLMTPGEVSRIINSLHGALMSGTPISDISDWATANRLISLGITDDSNVLKQLGGASNVAQLTYLVTEITWRNPAEPGDISPEQRYIAQQQANGIKVQLPTQAPPLDFIPAKID